MVGRKPTREQNPETIKLLEKLKQHFGYKTDRELAERYDMLPQELVSIKNGALSKLTKGVIEDLTLK